MIFTLTFKTPYVLDQAEDRVARGCGDPRCGDDGAPGHCLDCKSIEDSASNDMRDIVKCAQKFIANNEFIRIQFDTIAGTATVVPLKG